jgi:3-(methylthio)propanoyl-CoA dehydrogenase
LIPKFLVREDGSLGQRNDVRCVSLEEKLGIHASPTCVMSFGEEEGAIGYLVGEEQGGMRAMFTMMNNARLQVGLEGLATAERAYQAALAHARERIQGRRRNGGEERPARIIEHADVRRMLMTMKTQIEAMRALAYTAAAALDRARREPDAAARADAEGRLALLTPLVKAWCTDVGFEITSTALQVHGGMGYIEETGIAQLLRDARIAMIYEGTSGIQALDLVGRKLRMAEGRLPATLFEELRSDLAALDAAGETELHRVLKSAMEALEQATAWLQADHGNDPDAAAAGATPYLRLFATTLGGFLLARSALCARGTVLAASKRASAAFYVGQVLPPATALLPAVTAGSAPLDPERFASRSRRRCTRP